MLNRWLDFDDTVSLFNAFGRQLNHSFERPSRGSDDAGVALTFEDRGEHLVFTAVLPGVGKDELDITLEGDVLTVKAERKSRPSEKHQVVRAERRAHALHRRIELPCRVSADAVVADIEDGVLTVTLPKAPEAKPRQIAIGRRGSN